MANINELRFSLIYNAPIQFNNLINWELADPSFYKKEYDYAKNNTDIIFQNNTKPDFFLFRELKNTDGLYLTLPWRYNSKLEFWPYYLEIGDLNKIDFETAWNHLMPLRCSSIFQIVDNNTNIKIIPETFFFPTGIGVIITLIIKEAFSIKNIVKLVNDTYYSEFKVQFPGEQIIKLIKLENLAKEILKYYDNNYIIGKNKSNKTLDLPYKIATVINIKNVNIKQKIKKNSTIHKMLQGLCTLNPYLEKKSLKPIDDKTSFRLKEYNTPESHLLFGLDKGRAIWFPWYFDKPSNLKQLNILGSYHRNITLATLLCGSLISFTINIGQSNNNDKPIPPSKQNIVTKTLSIIGRLYGGAGTYKTWSIREQISKYEKKINTIRKFFYFDELHDNRQIQD